MKNGYFSVDLFNESEEFDCKLQIEIIKMESKICLIKD